MERYTRWDNDIKEIDEKTERKENPIVLDNKGWGQVIKLPESNSVIKDIKNLRLKNKRNKTNKKKNQGKTQNLTLDYYLK